MDEPALLHGFASVSPLSHLVGSCRELHARIQPVHREACKPVRRRCVESVPKAMSQKMPTRATPTLKPSFSSVPVYPSAEHRIIPRQRFILSSLQMMTVSDELTRSPAENAWDTARAYMPPPARSAILPAVPLLLLSPLLPLPHSPSRASALFHSLPTLDRALSSNKKDRQRGALCRPNDSWFN